ncbi:MAG: hypothetical protein JW910_18915 [Anaerolineae bacterium]|nr:hypothetical protein [Anaerolineae bacterium]
MNFQLSPRIYALMLCSAVTQDEHTGSWVVKPFSEIGVQRLPFDVPLTVFAQIMAPAGRYELALHLYHAADPDGTRQSLPPRPFVVQEGKNVDFVLHIAAHITTLGLYIVQAEITDHHRAVTPLRISAA